MRAGKCMRLTWSFSIRQVGVYRAGLSEAEIQRVAVLGVYPLVLDELAAAPAPSNLPSAKEAAALVAKCALAGLAADEAELHRLLGLDWANDKDPATAKELKTPGSALGVVRDSIRCSFIEVRLSSRTELGDHGQVDPSSSPCYLGGNTGR